MKFTISLILNLFSLLVMGQCPMTSELVFNAQSQIDSFLIKYPDCKFVESDIEISGDNINNLSGFINLNSIDGSLEIYDNKSLVDLNGLDNLNSITESLTISRNDNLENLNGLSNLTQLKSLALNNNKLSNLKGLGPVDSLDLLQLWGDNNLKSIEGLDELLYVQHIFLTGNISLNGFQQLDSVLLFTSFNNDSITNVSQINQYIKDYIFRLRIEDSSYFDINGGQNFNDVTSFNFKDIDELNLDSAKLISYETSYSMNACNSIKNLSSIVTNKIRGLTLFNMDSLNEIPNFDFPELVTNIDFRNNENLQNISALGFMSNLSFVNFVNNQKLSYCSYPPVCSLIRENRSDVTIEDNLEDCETVEAVESLCTTSTADLNNQTEVKIFPNPTQSQLSIESKQKIDRIDVYDWRGRFIKTVMEDFENIQVSNFENGLYIIKIISGSDMYSVKFSKF